MLIPTVIMGIMALTLVIISYHKEQHMTGLRTTFDMIINMLPLIIFAIIVAGMIQALMPKELLSRWIGSESGIKGLLIGTLAGAFAPGGPYVSLPIAAGLMRSGAGIGTMVAFLTGWSLWAVLRLPLDIGILGPKFTLIRFLSVFLFPPIAGLIAQFLAKIIK